MAVHCNHCSLPADSLVIVAVHSPFRHTVDHCKGNWAKCAPAIRMLPAIRTYEPALVNRVGVVTVWTDGSGRRSSDPQHRHCGVGYYTDAKERVFLPLPGIKQSVYCAELHAVARALEECQPHEVVSTCKGAVKAVQTLQTGRRQPTGRNRDLEQQAHLKQADVDIGRITADDLHGNGQADILANEGTAAHGDLEPEDTWLRWADFANEVFHFWRLVGPHLREKPDEEPRVKLPRELVAEEPEVPLRGMVPGSTLPTWTASSSGETR
eukprot:821958-Amphidinium_carterae.1